MSKMDALRAMREARYDQATARAAGSTAAPRKAAPPTPRRVDPARPDAAVPTAGAPGDDAARCGHRSMNGRTCTREPGHSAKSHRYS